MPLSPLLYYVKQESLHCRIYSFNIQDIFTENKINVKAWFKKKKLSESLMAILERAENSFNTSSQQSLSVANHEYWNIPKMQIWIFLATYQTKF